MICIGIDPGQKGGLAIIHGNGNVSVTSMILAGKDLDVAAIKDWIWSNIVVETDLGTIDWNKDIIAYLEKVHSMPEQGVSSVFKFGQNYGTLIGIIGTMGIPLHLVTPQAWKKNILAGTTKDKAAAKDFCRRVYPNVSLLATKRSRVVHDGMADALCIARYASLMSGE